MNPQNIEDIYRTSPLQAGLLFHSVEGAADGVYFEQSVCHLEGELNEVALWSAWADIVSRHAVLRTAFVWEGLPEPVQVVFRQVAVPREVQDWREWGSEEQTRRLSAYLTTDRARGWRLTEAPLWRLMLIQFSDRSWRLVWSHHHVLMDGWSVPVLLDEVLQCYTARQQGTQAELPPAPAYRDYIAWLATQDGTAADSTGVVW